jgi:hypothetical protein
MSASNMDLEEEEFGDTVDQFVTDPDLKSPKKVCAN